jgi:hypothetical protein
LFTYLMIHQYDGMACLKSSYGMSDQVQHRVNI